MRPMFCDGDPLAFNKTQRLAGQLEYTADTLRQAMSEAAFEIGNLADAVEASSHTGGAPVDREDVDRVVDHVIDNVNEAMNGQPDWAIERLVNDVNAARRYLLNQLS